MGTPGMKLIQDLLAKSVAKWGGDAIKSTEDDKKSIKIEESNIKVEYIEIETDPHDVKIEQDEVNDEKIKLKVKVGKKIKLDDTDKSRKKKKKALGSNYVTCDNAKDLLKTERDDVQATDQKGDKSLIRRMLKNSTAKYAENFEVFDIIDKTIQIEKTESKKLKKEMNIQTAELFEDDQFPPAVRYRLSSPLLNKLDDEGLDLSGVKMEEKTTGKVKCIELEMKKSERQIVSFKNLRKTNYSKRHFTPEEDEILLQEMDTLGENINFKNLALRLGRKISSIHTRIRRLKTGDRNFAKQTFSLTEDLLILDRMLERLPGKRLKDLEMLVDKTTPEFLTAIGRKMVSGPMKRWSIKLKPWILQHYAGTMNLDIKRMLANFIADTFDSHDTVDWSVVVNRPEFAGHTLSSLRGLYYANLFKYTKQQQKLDHAEVTLRNIADYTKTEHGVTRKVSENVLLRQKQVIDHFEQYVKKHGITNFL